MRRTVALYFPTEVKQSLETDLIRGELRNLGADVHVEAEQVHVFERVGEHRDGQSLGEGNSELHPLLSRARVWMRRIDQHLGIHSQRDRRPDAEALCYRIEHMQLLFG